MKIFRQRILLLRCAVSFMLILLVCNIASDTVIASQPTEVTFSTYSVQKRYYNDAGGYIELDLKLPVLSGSFRGIPKINDFFAAKEEYFFNDLPFGSITESEARYSRIEGQKSGHYRSARYRFETVLGHIISISAELDGGRGGVGWAGMEGNTFDLNTGRKLGLSDIFGINQGASLNIIYDLVSEILTNNINKAIEAGYGSPYWFDDVYEGKGYAIIRDYFHPDNFYLTHNSLVVFYEKYSLTAGAGGPQAFHIPYESIMDILSGELKETIIPPVPPPTDLSFEVKYVYTSWYSFPDEAMLLASCKPIRSEPVEGHWTWGYYNDGEIIVYPVGTIISYKWEDYLTQFQIRAYDNNTPMSDWVYEITLTEEMADRYMLLRWPSYNMDCELLIKVENGNDIESNIPGVDNEVNNNGESSFSGEADVLPPGTDNNEISYDDQGDKINEFELLSPGVITNELPGENEIVNVNDAESVKQSNSIEDSNESFKLTIMFFTGLCTGAVILIGGFLLLAKRR